jgi:O-antigen/teichoic acid export membrane protein
MLIAVSFILTRLYTPEDFGKLGVFSGVATIVGVFSTFRYHFAIVIADGEDETLNLFRLCVLLSCVTSAILCVAIVAYVAIMQRFSYETHLGWLWLFLPLNVLLGGLVGTWGSWCNRQKLYGAIAYGSISQSISSSIINVAFGLLYPCALGLIAASVLSQAANCISLILGLKKKGCIVQDLSRKPNATTRVTLTHVACKFRGFPQYSILADLANVASTHFPMILIAAFFSESMTGFVLLAQRVVGLPMSFIGTALGQVFYQRAAELKSDPEQLSVLLVKIYRLTLFLGIVPTAVLMFWGDILFAKAFGEEWRFAGIVCQFVAPSFLFQFVSSPLSSVFWIDAKQNQFTKFCMLLFLGRVASILVPTLLGASFDIVALCYGAIGLILWIGLTILVLAQRCRTLLGILVETFAIVAIVGCIGYLSRSLIS